MLEGFGFYSDSGCYGDTTPLSCLIKVEIIDQSDVTKLKGIITGPPDTPNEGEKSA